MADLRALVTNDDGIDSRGIALLAEAAAAAGLEVVVAAPDGQRSGAAASLSALEADGRLLVEPRELQDLAVPAFAVHASPAMIALVGARGAFGEPPDVVLSGINHGLNTGQSTLHSGTVGAALTAASMGVPALALSFDVDGAPENPGWATARAGIDQALGYFLANLDAHGDDPFALNANVPDVAPAALRGLRTATLAAFGSVRATFGERGEGYVGVTLEGVPERPAPGSDVALLAEGWVTLTAMRASGLEAAVELPAPR